MPTDPEPPSHITLQPPANQELHYPEEIDTLTSTDPACDAFWKGVPDAIKAYGAKSGQPT